MGMRAQVDGSHPIAPTTRHSLALDGFREVAPPGDANIRSELDGERQIAAQTTRTSPSRLTPNG
jgi:hypothetical protein